MTTTKLHELAMLKQSIWLDYISRELIDSGKLKELIDNGVLGMTSNPSIFDKAISGGEDYDREIKDLKATGKSTFEIYDDLTVKDVKDALDLFYPIYEKTNGEDGFVSLEVNPELANKTEETIIEADRIFNKVKMPNLLVKIPATAEGYSAIEMSISKGINVNVTLIFSLDQYVKTAEAYIRGLEKYAKSGGNLGNIHSVASVFVSRIDTYVDKMLDEAIEKENDAAKKNKIKNLKGKSAVANTRIIYSKYLEIFSGERFKSLDAMGARTQRALWGSTGTKGQEYSDIKYVTELIGKGTVNTIPGKTLDAFLDHGEVKESIASDPGDSNDILNAIKTYGIDMNKVCKDLLDKGVKSFIDSFRSLLESIEKKAS